MLRSLIAHALFFIAIVASPLTGLQSARAEMPFEAWLSMAADSIDHQISQQIELPWQTLGLMGQRTTEGFDHVMNQCRMGVGGTRGLQFVRLIDLLVELRDSGVAGVVAPRKNWNFPAENFELQRCRIVQGERRSHQCRNLKEAMAPTSISVTERVSAFLGHGNAGRQLLHQFTQLASQAKEAMDQLEEEVYRPAQPLVQAANRVWDKFTATSRGENQTEVSDSAAQAPGENTISDAAPKAGVLSAYMVEVSSSAQARLNWLTSKVRRIAEACMKSVEPQFLILEFDNLENRWLGDGFEGEILSHPSVAELPHATH